MNYWLKEIWKTMAVLIFVVIIMMIYIQIWMNVFLVFDLSLIQAWMISYGITISTIIVLLIFANKQF